MNEKRDRETFEDKLLGELKTVVANRAAEQEAAAAAEVPQPRPSRVPRLALGGAAALATAAAVFAVSSGGDGTSKAFAVEQQDGGGVTIEVYSAEDASGLEAALAEAGIRSQVDWLPAGMTCREPRFKSSSAPSALGGELGGMTVAGPAPALTFGVMSGEEYRDLRQQVERGEITSDEFYAATGNVTLDPATFREDQTVVVSGSPGPYDGDPEGGFEASFAIAEGPVEPCDPVAIPAGSSLEQMNRVLREEAARK